jgi:polyketide synthase PksN
MAGHYPQADTLQEFWENLCSGRDCVGEIPWERWRVGRDFYEPDRQQALANKRSYSKWGAFLERFADFDPLFFNMSPREAMTTDPQERLFLQTCWESLEDAGYTRARLSERHGNRVGVFAGVTKTGFELHAADLWRRGDLRSPFTCFGSIANRVSYSLNLNGPSMPIDTMCSASLTAVHEACEHLLRGECEMALAGGVNLYLHPSSYVYLCEFGVLSPGGRCQSFGQGADGIVPGEGVGVLLLKPLSRAVTDGDRIYALIRSSSINHGGRANGYTVPSPVAQRDLVHAALERGAVHPRAVSCLEAHGTGTQLGDPIEITGLTQAFRRHTEDRQFCALGSLKSNIGHLEAAAGVASLTKVVLQMMHGQLVPSLHARDCNPLIDFAGSPFFVQQELGEWQRPRLQLDGELREYPRIAGVSSFGAGGANAHVIVEEYIEPRHQTAARHHAGGAGALVILSARNAQRLRSYVQCLLVALESGSWTDDDLLDIAYTLQTGREAMEARLALHVRSLADLRHKLQRFLAGDGGSDAVLRAEGVRLKQNQPGGDAQLAQAIDSWLTKGEHSNLLRLWIEGTPIDWDALYRTSRPRRVTLPTYPFARERYWPLDQHDVAPVAEHRAQITLEPLTGPITVALSTVADNEHLGGELADDVVPGALRQKDATALPTLSPESLQQQVVESLAAALYMTPEQVDVDTRFVDLGMDSIVGVEWTRALNRQFSITLPVTRLYDYPTVRELTAYLRTKLNGRVVKCSDAAREPGGAIDQILQRVQQGTLDPALAVGLLQQAQH